MSRFMEGGRQVNQGRKTSHSHTLFDLLAIEPSLTCLILLHTPKLQNCTQNKMFELQLLLFGAWSRMPKEAHWAFKKGPYRKKLVIRNAIVVPYFVTYPSCGITNLDSIHPSVSLFNTSLCLPKKGEKRRSILSCNLIGQLPFVS